MSVFDIPASLSCRWCKLFTFVYSTWWSLLQMGWEFSRQLSLSAALA